jgi:hypothetical protein
MLNHILNHISVLIARDGKTLVTLKKTETIFNGLDESLKNKSWKIRKTKLTEINSLLLVLLLPQLETTQMNFRFCCSNPESRFS